MKNDEEIQMISGFLKNITQSKTVQDKSVEQALEQNRVGCTEGDEIGRHPRPIKVEVSWVKTYRVNGNSKKGSPTIKGINTFLKFNNRKGFLNAKQH